MKRPVVAACIGAALFAAPVPASAEEAHAIFAGGCFWCVESDFDKVAGVISTTSGYIGGDVQNPTYENHEGHREAVDIVYDTDQTDYATLLETFWRTVDPTDDGGQFCDRGFAYTTAIFPVDDEQAAIAANSKEEAQAALGQTIVTEVVPGQKFWPAEDYHQDYYKKNPVNYTYYRRACGRDLRVTELWGDAAMTGVAGH